MNRLWISSVAMIVSGVVGIASPTNCEACPPVAAAQATAGTPAAVAFAQPVAVAAPLAQAVVGTAYAQPTSVAATVAVAQPLVVAQPTGFAPLHAVAKVGCAAGACARATARVGVAGVRRILLPRHRAVARAVVR